MELEKQRLELEKMRFDCAYDAANKLIDMLNPDIDKETRIVLIQALLPNLQQLLNVKGLQLALPPPQNDTSNRTENSSDKEPEGN